MNAETVERTLKNELNKATAKPLEIEVLSYIEDGTRTVAIDIQGATRDEVAPTAVRMMQQLGLRDVEVLEDVLPPEEGARIYSVYEGVWETR